jgi:hypothetical protein
MLLGATHVKADHKYVGEIDPRYVMREGVCEELILGVTFCAQFMAFMAFSSYKLTMLHVVGIQLWP